MIHRRFSRGDLVRVAYTGGLDEYIDHTVCLVIDTRIVKMYMHTGFDEEKNVDVMMVRMLRKGKVLEWQSAESYVPYFDE